MSLYAGETALIKHTAKLDDVALTFLDVASCDITIYDVDLVEILPATPMVWNSTLTRWEYSWDTPGPSAATFKAKIEITGLDGAFNWEYKTIRLKAAIV